MSKTKHTPGPWTTSAPNKIDAAFIIYACGKTIGYMKGHVDRDQNSPARFRAGCEEAEANAALIAAAPELLEALEEILSDWELITYAEVPEKARAAIAKAKPTPQKIPAHLLPIEELGCFFNTEARTIHPMNVDGSPDLYAGSGVHIDDLDMPERFEMESEIAKAKETK